MMCTAYLGKVHVMPSKYDRETQAKSVRLVLEDRDDPLGEWAAITAPRRTRQTQQRTRAATVPANMSAPVFARSTSPLELTPLELNSRPPILVEVPRRFLSIFPASRQQRRSDIRSDQ